MRVVRDAARCLKTSGWELDFGDEPGLFVGLQCEDEVVGRVFVGDGCGLLELGFGVGGGGVEFEGHAAIKDVQWGEGGGVLHLVLEVASTLVTLDVVDECAFVGVGFEGGAGVLGVL